LLKRITLNIVIVILVVFVLDFAIGRILRYFYFKETSGLNYRTTYSMETTQADILVFGASRANHHYIPEIFEDSLKMTFYNTGRDGMGVFYQLALLKSTLKRYTPKVVILDYTGGLEKGEKDYDRLSSLLPYYRTHEEIKKIIELKSPFESLKLISEIFPFNSQVLTIIIGNLEINKIRDYDNKGYIASYEEWQSKIDSISYTKYLVDSNKVNAFKEFIDISKNSGVKVFVSYSPIFLKINKLQEIDICNEICSSENVTFLDYTKDTLFLNNSHLFSDAAHLNHNGAVLFSNLIVDKIKQDINKNMP
jgi:hypothetical protein